MVDVICPPLSISSIVVSLWLAGCLAKSTLIGWREYYGGGGVGVDRHLCGAQQTRGFDPMLFHYWPTAKGAGPTLKQHRVKASCLLGKLSALWYTWAVCVWLEQAVHSALCRRWCVLATGLVALCVYECVWPFLSWHPGSTLQAGLATIMMPDGGKCIWWSWRRMDDSCVYYKLSWYAWL